MSIVRIVASPGRVRAGASAPLTRPRASVHHLALLTIPLETLLEAGVLAGLAWPLLRLITHRAFWSAFPRVAVRAVGLLAAYAALLAVLALRFPLALRFLAVPAALLVAYESWHARPGYGRARRLPPGSLVPVPLFPFLDDRAYLQEAARHGPVFKTSQLGLGGSPNPCPVFSWRQGVRAHLGLVHPMVCVVGLDRATEILRRFDDVLVPPAVPFSRFIPGGFFRYMAGEPHRRYRQLFRVAFSGRVVKECEPDVVTETRRALRAMAEEGAAADGARPDPHLARMAATIFVRVFFGIEAGAPAGTRLEALYRVLAVPRNAPARAVRPALAEAMAIARAGATAAVAPASFLGELGRSRPEALDDPTVLANLVYMAHTTSRDVADLMAWILKLLGDHPAWVARLRQDAGPDADRDGGLADRVVQETLRLAQSEYLYRKVPHDLEIDGRVVPRGWLLRLCIRESHRDPRVFDRPDAFDPDRFLGRTYPQAEYAPFGAFDRSCLGIHLTVTVARLFVTTLAREFDWTVVADGPQEFRGWHWAPSSRFRIRVTPRLAPAIAEGARG
jgi:cytochrome P450